MAKIGTSVPIDDSAYDASWDGETSIAPSKNAVYDKIESMGGGAVDSVNGQTGVVVLDADDIDDTSTTQKFTDAASISKLAGIEANADVTDATNVAAAGAFMKSTDDTDDITEGTTNKWFTAAEETKLGHITVTQAVDLDTMESDIAGKQPLDADLTAIAGLDSSTSGAIASDGAGWIKKTYAQLKTALGLVKADVGLGNVDNTSDANKPVSTATQTALDGKVDENVAITGATKTKITYDAKGLVTSGADATQDDIGDGSTYKQYSATEKTKLAGIEAGADVTDATNVDAAGATMNTDTSLVGNSYFLDEDAMTSDSATKVPSQQSVKAYADTKLAKSSNLSDVADVITSRKNLGVGVPLKIHALGYLGHSWTAGIGLATNGTPQFQRQGFMGRLAGMLGIPDQNVKSFGAIAGAYMIRPVSVFSSPYSGWAGMFAFGGSYSGPNHAGNSATIRTQPAEAQPWPLVITHGINDAAYYGASHTAATHAQIRNAYKHALRGILSKHRSGSEWGSKLNSSAIISFDSKLTFSGTWGNSSITPRERQGAGGSGPATKQSSTNTDYVEFAIPADFPGGTLAFSWVSQLNGKTTLLDGFIGNASADLDTARTQFTVADGVTTFPTSGNFIIKMDNEQMLVTAGQGTSTWTVTRGFNGSTAATHTSGAEITIYQTGLIATYSGSAGVTGTVNLQAQGAIGAQVCVISRFPLTAANAGQTIRATISGIVASDTWTKAQFDAVWLEAVDPPPVVIENVTSWVSSGTVPYSYLTEAEYEDYNTDIDTIVAEFDDRIQVADVNTQFKKGNCTPQSSMSSGDTTTTVNVTVEDVTAFGAKGTGWILQRAGEYMLVTASSFVSGSTYSITVTRGLNGSTKQTHGTSTVLVDQTIMHTDLIHPNARGHAVRAKVIYDAFNSITVIDDYEEAMAANGITQQTMDNDFGVVDNYWQLQRTAGTLTANTTFTKDKLWYWPFRVPERCILTGIGIVTGTSAGTSTNARYGIYAMGINRGEPGVLIAELGQSATTATTSDRSITTHLVLEPGMYWAAVVNQGTTAGGVRSVTGANYIPPSPIYVGAIPTGTSLSYFKAQTGVTGALPASATPVEDNGPIPFVWLRFAKPPYL